MNYPLSLNESFFLFSHHALTFISFINTHRPLSTSVTNHQNHTKSELHLLHTSYPLHLFSLPDFPLGFPNPHRQPLLPHPPVRVFCCRITLCLLRFVLCSRPITTTGEVTGVGLHILCCGKLLPSSGAVFTMSVRGVHMNAPLTS